MPETKRFSIHQSEIKFPQASVHPGIHKEELKIDCLYLSGELDAHTAPQLESAFLQLISQGRKKIIVNFGELNYISSAGLGVFMAFIEEIRESGGDIKLANMQPKVYSVFDLLGFPILFDIVDDEKIAVEKFNLVNS
ncbi:MAG: STAS domain-containing protein [FCB group bacterium]|jgi:anti-sigma B factor antagonist